MKMEKAKRELRAVAGCPVGGFFTDEPVEYEEITISESPITVKAAPKKTAE
jgi:hypothetical protein